MNPKRWFTWGCLALALVTEIFLFRANHERDALSADLREAQHQFAQASAEVDRLKNSNAGLQAAENARLRKQNEILSTKLSEAQSGLARAQAANQALTRQLETARTALGLQQEHLQQLQGEKQQLASAGVSVLRQNTCLNNLRQIDAAKQQWATDKGKTDADVPTAQDLQPYLKDGLFPACPDGGAYSINAVNQLPGCSTPGHALPQ